MRILLTNDDGIMAGGLAALYRELSQLGEVTVVAPETVQSAAGHGITISGPLLTSRVAVGDAFTGTAVAGSPADCVKLAISQIMRRPPDLVVSGLNAGANVGINVVYSGTVAAAIEAAFLGLPAVALSLYLRSDVVADYAGASRHGCDVIRQLLDAGLKGGDVVSVNMPAIPAGAAPAGVKVVRQCTRPWTDTYERRKDPKGRTYFWNSSVFTLTNTDDDTDVAALRDGFITVTPLQFDLTEHRLLKQWRRRKWATRDQASKPATAKRRAKRGARTGQVDSDLLS